MRVPVIYVYFFFFFLWNISAFFLIHVTDIGGSKKEQFGFLPEAKHAFQKLYLYLVSHVRALCWISLLECLGFID